MGVFGPVLGPDYSTSILVVQRLVDGAVPGLPRFTFGVVDVRDVADLHVRAMTHPAARGERFLATAGPFLSIREIAAILKRRLGAAAREVSGSLVWLTSVGPVDEPYLLVESDLLYERRAPRLLVESPHEDVLLASGPTNSGDEVYVGANDGRVVDLSKRRDELRGTRVFSSRPRRCWPTRSTSSTKQDSPRLHVIIRFRSSSSRI